MKPKTIEKIVNTCIETFEDLDPEELTLINSFNIINEIASKYHKKEGVETIMNITYSNSHPVCGICLVTDFTPNGAILFQSEENFVPKLRVIFPEEMDDIIEEYKHWFSPDYPEIFDEEDDDEEPYDLDLSEEEQEEMWDNFD